MATGPKRNRRPLNVATQWQPSLIAIQIAEASGAVITASLLLGIDPIDPVVINGIPQLLAGGVAPISAVSIGGGDVEFTYPAPVTPGNALFLDAWDPAFRWPRGGYLAPYVGVVPAP